jgi:hypothetical protein
MLAAMPRAPHVLRAALGGLGALAVLASAGCPGDPSLTCVEDVDFATCQPLYAPTWDTVYTNTIADTCATSRACHAATAASSRIVLEGSERAYTSLVAGGYVVPGQPACSELIERLYTKSASLLMPRGTRLPAAEACAIGPWVAAGAPGPAALVDAGVAP